MGQGYPKNIEPYVTYSFPDYNTISLYIDPKVSEIFDSPGANYCNVSCNGKQTGILTTGDSFIKFTGLSAGTQYAVTIDILYAAGYSGNYGYQTLYLTMPAPVIYYTVTTRHYKGNTYYTTTTDQIPEGTKIFNMSDFAISIKDYEYWQTTATESRSGTLVISPTINSNVTYYAWYDPVTQYCTLTFNHYLQLADGSMSRSPSATTSASVAVNSHIYLENYNYNYGFGFDSYCYSYGTSANGSTIVKDFYASGNETYNLYYDRITYEISTVAGTGISSVSGSNTTWWGNTITTVAYTNTGYNFSKWTSNKPEYLSDSTNPYYTFVVPKADVTLTATATPKTSCTLKLYCSGYTTTVTGNTTTSTNGGNISITVYAGDPVTISCTVPNNTTYYTYTLQGWYTAANGGGDRWNSSMSFTYTMPATDVTLYAYTTRTAGFAWAIGKTVGSKTLTAAEWQALQSFVNTQRKTAYTFQHIPSVGDTLSAAMYNEMVAAIGKGTTVSKGQAISASLMNALVTDANAMK